MTALRHRVAPEPSAGRPPASPLRRWWPLLIGGALASALCLWQLGTRSLWLDEGASLAIAQQHGTALWSAIAHDGGNMLAYYLGLHLLIAADSAAITATRLPSTVCAVMTVICVSAIARRQLSSRAAFTAGSLAAVSLPLVFWAQDIRGYAAMTAFVAGSYLAFVALADGSGDRRRGLWVAWFACTVIACYCGFAALLVLPAQGLALIGRHVRRRSALASSAAVLIACAPLLALAAARGTGQLFWVGAPSVQEVGQTLRWLTSAALQPNFRPAWASVPLLLVSLGLLACVPPAAWFAGAGRRRWTALVAAWWLLVPFALDLAESLAGQPVLLTRNSLVSLPAVALALAWLLDAPRLPAPAWAVALTILLVLRAAVLVPAYGTSPEDWAAASRYVLAGARPGDCAMFYPQDGRMPFDVYAQSDSRAARLRPVLPGLAWATARPFVESYRAPTGARLGAALHDCARLWLVVSHAGQRAGPPVSRGNLARYLALRQELARRGRRPAARRSFGYAAAVDVTLLTGAARSPRR